MRQKTVIKNLLQSVTEVYYKVGQVLQSASGITKCDRLVLQSASGITKCDRLVLQSASGITKCGRLLLQSVSDIKKCDSYYKVRRNTVSLNHHNLIKRLLRCLTQSQKQNL